MTKSIVLAGGCFWAVEHLYRSLPGVLSAHSGYANGRRAEWADYEKVCTGLTGFREAVQVTYDPDVISLRRLLFGERKSSREPGPGSRNVIVRFQPEGL